MATETKTYKPGQFVWIGGKKHRVTKTSYTPACKCCPYRKGNGCTCLGWTCVFYLPSNCYPKPV